MKEQYWLEHIHDAEDDGRFLIEVTVHNTDISLIALTKDGENIIQLTHAEVDRLIELLQEAKRRSTMGGIKS